MLNLLSILEVAYTCFHWKKAYKNIEALVSSGFLIENMYLVFGLLILLQIC